MNESTTPKPGQLTPIDEMLAILLETWEKRYAFQLDRATKKAEFRLGQITIHAEEMPDGSICVSFVDSHRHSSQMNRD